MLWSCVRGYHYYQNIWDLVIDEVLACVREDGNPHDRYPVAVYKNTQVIGHVARKISTVCYLFLQKGGAISCVVTDTRRYSYDLPQGTIEIPCLLKFRGNSIIQKVKQLLQRDKDEDINAEMPLNEPPVDYVQQDRCYNFSLNFVQIIHCLRRHHWIAASNIGCPHNSVNVYDSLFSDLDAATYKLISNMFGEDECEISMRKVQVQAGVKDCGVFSIAFIASGVHEQGTGRRTCTCVTISLIVLRN